MQTSGPLFSSGISFPKRVVEENFVYARPKVPPVLVFPSRAKISSTFPSRVPQTKKTTFVFSRPAETATKTFLYSRPFASQVETKTQTEKIADVLTAPVSTAVRRERIQKIISPDAETSTLTSLSNALAVIWTNSKSLVYLLVASSSVAIGLWLVQVYFGQGGWMDLLNILKNLGLKAIPLVLYRALKSAGVNIAADISINSLLGLAEKNQTISKILAAELKPQWAEGLLSKMGVEISDYDLTVKNLTRKAVSNAVSGGFALASGNVASYLTSTVTSTVTSTTISAVVSRGKKAAEGASSVLSSVLSDQTPGRKEKVAQRLDRSIRKMDQVKQATVEEILGGTFVDTLTTSEKLHSSTIRAEGIVKSPSKKAPVVTEKLSVVTDMITENKALIYGTATAAALVSLALASSTTEIGSILAERLQNLGGAAIDSVVPLASGAFDFVKESAVARSSLFGIISNQIGLSQLVSNMVDYITPESLTKLQRLEGKIKKGGPKAATRTEQFFALLVGDRIYSKSELSKLSIGQLKKIASTKNLRIPGSIEKESLVSGILDEQTSRLNNISVLVAGMISKSVKGAIASAALEYGYQTLADSQKLFGQTLSETEVKQELWQAKHDTMGETKLDSAESTDLNREIFIENGPETRQEFETRVDAEWNLQMEKAQTALAAERKVARELRKFQEENDEVEIRGVLAEKLRLEREVKLEQNAKTQAVYVRRQAARRLKDAAILDSLTEKIGVIVSDSTGTATAIPTDNLLLDPKLQEALKSIEFTPLMQYLSRQAAKSTLGWVPGIGWVASAINSVNWGLDVAEKIKDAYSVANVVLELRSETGESSIDIGSKNIENLDVLLKKRIPTIADAVDNLLTLEKVNLKVTVLEVLRDKVLYGWTDRQVAVEIGKRVLAGKELSSLADATVEKVGGMIWSAMGNS